MGYFALRSDVESTVLMGMRSGILDPVTRGAMNYREAGAF